LFFLFLKVHPDNSEWTCFEQSASLEVKSFFGFEQAVEKLAAKHYAANINKAKEILDYHIEELRKENITYVPQFSDQITCMKEISIIQATQLFDC